VPEYRPVEKPLEWFRPNDENYRGHPEAQIELLRGSLREFGVFKNVVAREDGTVLAGHGIIAAAKAEGIATLPVHVFTGTDAEARALMVADNELSRPGLVQDDPDQLSQLLTSLQADGLMQVTGHDDASLAALLEEVAAQNPPTGFVPEEDPGPVEPPLDPVTRLGDVWVMGEHRLVCGDCTDAGVWEAALKGRKANVVFTSPPYAMQRKEQYGGVPADQYVDWFLGIAALAWANLADDGSFFVNIKPHAADKQRSLYVMDLVCGMVRVGSWLFVDEFCWLRTGIPQQVVHRFKNAFEPVYHFAKGDFAFYPEAVRHKSDAVPLALGPGAGDTNAARRQGKGGGAIQGNDIVEGMAYPSNVLNFKQNAEAIGHPAAFPVNLPDFFCRAYGAKGDAVFDPFMGSGTTMIAAEQSGRVACGAELLPQYVDVAVLRYQRMTHKPAILESSGETFDALSARPRRGG